MIKLKERVIVIYSTSVYTIYYNSLLQHGILDHYKMAYKIITKWPTRALQYVILNYYNMVY